MPHQITDASFLAGRDVAGCFNGMGTGKTLTALEACRLAEAENVLIIGPPISLQMWQREAEDWLGSKAQILKTGSTKIDASVRVLVVSYQIAVNRKNELMEWAGPGSVMICDESHALKNTKAKRTVAILGRGGMINAFKHAWFLTGTPMTRWADDLIPFLFRAAPDQIKDLTGGLTIDRFRLRYCITVKKQWPGARFPVEIVVGSRNHAELGEVMATCSTRRILKDVWESMPSITFTRLAVQPKGTKDLLDALKAMTMTQVEAGLRSNDDHLSTIRRQLGVSMIPDAASFIADRVDAEQGAILVGAWHTEVIDGLMEALSSVKIDKRSLRVATLDGRTSQAKKSELEAAYNNGGLDVLIGQIGAMGVSLNLQQGGSSIVVVEEDWSPAVMDQFYARLHRMGQGLPVHVDTLYVDSKIAEAVHRISTAKRHAHAAVSDAHQEGLDQ